jgi:uncharacterized protein YgbK (DUF1537 family)
MRQTWVIADDLTGAADSGIAFARPGRHVRLDLDPAGPAADHGETGGYPGETGPAGAVRIVDTDTRDADPADVPDRIRTVLTGIRPGDHVLKKVDSLLRGGIAQELRILRDGLPGRLLVIAPAVPAVGRTTAGGHVRVATDVTLRDLRIADHVPAQTVRHIRLETVRAGSRSVGAAVQNAQTAGTDAVICDAENDDDLNTLVSGVLAAGPPVLWVGAAGLAAALARGLGYSGPPGEPVTPPAGETVLVVVGSHHAIGRAQARALAAAGIPSVEFPVADLVALTAPQLAAALPAGPGCRVVSVAGDVDPDLRERATAALAAICAPAVRAADVVVLTGGATARAVLTAAGVSTLHLVGELTTTNRAGSGSLVPGAVLSRPCGTARPTHVITKSGSFGDDRTLVRLVAAITASRGQP